MFVTTSTRTGDLNGERARAVASMCGIHFVARTMNLRPLLKRHGAELVYVVGADHESLSDGEHAVFVHPGAFHHVLDVGAGLPLARAARPDGSPPVRTLIDATLGLGKDAVHLAHLLDCEVLGIETSPVLYALLESGLRRLAAETAPWREAAARVTPVLGDSVLWMDQASAKSADVVYLDPMFETARAGAPGFDLLRRVASHQPLDDRALSAAVRVARLRVVVRVGRGETPPALRAARRVQGKSVDYLVVECDDTIREIS